MMTKILFIVFISDFVCVCVCSEQAASRQRESGSRPGELVSAGGGQPVSEHQKHLSSISVSVSRLQNAEASNLLTRPLLLPQSLALQTSSALGYFY